MKGWRGGVLVFVLVAAACSGPPSRREGPYPLDSVLRLNEIQVLGTHNSYHQRPSTEIPGMWTDYEHPPLNVQLGEEGIRSVELDVSNTRDFSVEHDPYFDDRSNCTPLSQCLQRLKRWSEAHPRHVAIFVLIEAKDPNAVLDLERDEWDAASLDRLDDAVRSGLGVRNLVTPDDVRGDASTLRDAVVRKGWPTLSKVRGKFVVVLNRVKLRRAFLAGRPSLEGRAMFVPAYENAPSAAFIELDIPDEEEIQRLVRRGFVVRTRADADGVEVKAGDFARSQEAIESGAQIISTDYPRADTGISDYFVRLPNGRLARCNPVNAPARCRAADVERTR